MTKQSKGKKEKRTMDKDGKPKPLSKKEKKERRKKRKDKRREKKDRR